MKRWMIMAGLLTTVFTVAGCGEKVSFEEAKALALKDAGVSADEADFIKEKQDDEYEFQFETEEYRFEYEISKSGKIESKEKEILPRKSVTEGAGQQNTAEGTAAGEAATGESNTGESGNEANNSGESKDAENKVQETAPARKEASGQTSEPAVSAESSEENDIGQEQAKKIALEKAGLEESQVRRIKVKKEMENGLWVYEVEFDQGRTEYDCEINAATGEILKYETDIDD